MNNIVQTFFFALCLLDVDSGVYLCCASILFLRKLEQAVEIVNQG
ncbi:MAG: hypothetical protein ABGY95_02395 [Rubritalea sp.]